jgi:hypothetical protein
MRNHRPNSFVPTAISGAGRDRTVTGLTNRRKFGLIIAGSAGAVLTGIGKAQAEPRQFPPVQPDVMEKLNTADAERRKTLAELDQRLKTLADQYSNALEKLKPTFQQEARLDAILAVNAEIEQTSAGIVPQTESAIAEISRLQRIYTSQVSQIGSRYSEALIKAEVTHSEKLQELISVLTLAGRAQEAVAVGNLKTESDRRTALFKDMARNRSSYLPLHDDLLCRIVESPENDGKVMLQLKNEVTRQIKRGEKEKIAFKEAIYVPASQRKESIVEFDVPPGFRFLSVIGVGKGDEEYVWGRRAQFEITADGELLSKFASDGEHWLKIIRLPINTKKIRLQLRKNTHDNNHHSHWAWPRLHTGFDNVGKNTGWPPKINALYEPQ